MLVGAHHCGGGIARHRRLAHREHMRSGADMFEKLDQIIDIVIEVEPSILQRYIARIAPVGDPNVMARKHPLHCAAKQRRVMARHRRDDQQLGLVRRRTIANEMLELSERLAAFDLFGDRYWLAINGGYAESEIGLTARHGGVGENVECGRHDRTTTKVRERIGYTIQPVGLNLRQIACPSHPVFLNFITRIKHSIIPVLPQNLWQQYYICTRGALHHSKMQPI